MMAPNPTTTRKKSLVAPLILGDLSPGSPHQRSIRKTFHSLRPIDGSLRRGDEFKKETEELKNRNSPSARGKDFKIVKRASGKRWWKNLGFVSHRTANSTFLAGHEGYTNMAERHSRNAFLG